MLQWMKRAAQTEHRFCQDNLSAFLDKQLTPREQARVTMHLQECARCRSDLASLRQTVAALRAVPALKPPRTFFLPAGEGVRQRQVQRSRVAYGYLQFATAVATVLLVLVVSGDALLRLGVAGPSRQVPPPRVEIIALDKRAAEPEPMPSAVAELQAPMPEEPAFGAVPPPSGEATEGAMLAQPALPVETGQAETERAVADNQAAAAKSVPSQTFARPAGAPPLPTATPESGVTATLAGETGQPELTAALQVSATEVVETPVPAPTETPVPPTTTPLPTDTLIPPTATPVPTETPVPSTATALPPVEPPSPPPARVELTREPPPPPAGPWQWLQAMQPLLPWLEWTLGVLVAVLLLATLWLRRKQRAT